MTNRIVRRDFLRTSAAVAAAAAVRWPLVGHAAEADAAGKLSAEVAGQSIAVQWAGKPLTGYKAETTQKLPYLFPLIGPASGVSVTTETSQPYPHHHSVFFGCDHVNGGNYWQDTNERGQIVSAGPKLGSRTETSLEILDQCQWRQPGKPPIAADQRTFTIRVPGPRVRFIDARIKLTAVQDLTVTKTNHSLFSVRALKDITPSGGGTLVNSEGQQGEKATFGKPAKWCAFFGKRSGVPGEIVEGVALLYHPQNPWRPCPWFTRDYGFMSPSPMNFLDKPWQLPKGQSIDLRYRVVFFAGTPTEIGLEKIYQEWIAG